MAVASLFTYTLLTDGRTARDLPKQHPEKTCVILLCLLLVVFVFILFVVLLVVFGDCLFRLSKVLFSQFLLGLWFLVFVLCSFVVYFVFGQLINKSLVSPRCVFVEFFDTKLLV